MTPHKTEDELGAWEQSARLSFRFIIIAVAGLTLWWLTSNIREVPADGRAVVTRLGDIQREHGPGLLFAWPRPLEEVILIPSADKQISLAIQQYEQPYQVQNGSRDEAGGVADNSLMFGGYILNSDPRANGAFLLTGDSSVIHLDAVLLYQITNPRGYVLTGHYLQTALTRIYNASAITLAASRDLDQILVARPEAVASIANDSRERFRSDLVAAMNHRLEALAKENADLGVRITRADLSPSIPAGAKSAFDFVLVASQRADEEVAQARTAAEVRMQAARQETDQIATRTVADAQERITEANSRTAAVTALSRDNPNLAPQVLRNRFYYERIREILGKAGQIETVHRDAGRIIVPGAAP